MLNKISKTDWLACVNKKVQVHNGYHAEFNDNLMNKVSDFFQRDIGSEKENIDHSEKATSCK